MAGEALLDEDLHQTPPSFWRIPPYYGCLIFGYAITAFCIALVARIFGSDEMTRAEGIVLNIAMQVLSLLAGYTFARSIVIRRQRKHAP